MGSSSSKKGGSKQQQQQQQQRQKTGFFAIQDKYTSLDQVQDALRKCGLESSNLIIGVDFTKSNTWTGKSTYGGHCLHEINPAAMNPYQTVIDIMGRTLEPFDDDKLIPAYGFGDASTSDKAVFPFFPNEQPCVGVAQVLQRYGEIAPQVRLSGPTSFAPLVDKAIEIVERTKQYHILVIIADGQVSSPNPTASSIVRASNYPLSIIMIGVGDGPWDEMERYDDELPSRKFDNFQFVNFYQVMTKPRVENYDCEFAITALQEIPEQFAAIKRLGLLG